jgi:hypothetical protein
LGLDGTNLRYRWKREQLRHTERPRPDSQESNGNSQQVSEGALSSGGEYYCHTYRWGDPSGNRRESEWIIRKTNRIELRAHRHRDFGMHIDCHTGGRSLKDAGGAR